MVTPVNLQLAHWNLEHTAQQTRDPAAAAAQAGQQGEVLAAAEQRDFSVQQMDPSAEKEGIARKKRQEEEEKREGRRRRKPGGSKASGKKQAPESSLADTGKFDLYA
ncbi:MAG: hypothetical protein GX181_00415 [Synergistaceae bacterium]|nr:hypothetical protein [Synergistota bacterium]NLM70406.1 hypothetical protein [Synergistaceae bacterium]